MKKNIENIDKYWKLSNYLTVAFMYLNKNYFLSRELEIGDLREHPSGHWGTSPGINFILAHINYFICKYHKKIQLVVGPGHAGNAIFVNLLLEGTIHEYYRISESNKKEFMNEKLYQDLNQKIRAETSPFLPGMIYDGGELGYSLPVAFGSVLDQPDLLSICIIGDGEFETGTISAAWRCKQYMGLKSGFVLPILHMNGYRMGGLSLLSSYKDTEIKAYFKSMGYEARFVHFEHQEMIDAFDWVMEMYAKIREQKQEVWPVIILKSSKGYSAPNFRDIKIENEILSHKNPLAGIRKQDQVVYLKYWLNSYYPRELVDDFGYPQKEIMQIIPQDDLRIGMSLKRYKCTGLKVPKIEKFNQVIDEKYPNYSNIMILDYYFQKLLKENTFQFRIFSPDELKSNRLNKLNKTTGSKDDISFNGVLEILNENICQAWLQGYVLTGRNGIIISYEAFMPIIDSMVSQYSKWVFQSKRIPWRNPMASITYLLTSLCEENTYSHQNPEFISSVIANEHEFVRVYLPMDANSLLITMEQCILSKDLLQVVLVSKQNLPQYIGSEEAKAVVKQGYWIDDSNLDEGENIDIVFAAAGDYCVRECNEARILLNQYLPDKNVRIVTVNELTMLGDHKVYPHAITNQEFEEIFTKDKSVIFSFHGYACVIKLLLYDRGKTKQFSILGYHNQSVAPTNDLNKMILNGNSRYQIVIHACRMLYEKQAQEEISEIIFEMQNKINEQIKRYVI